MRKRGKRRLSQNATSEWGRRRIAADLSLRDLVELTGINIAFLSLLDHGRYVPTPEEESKLLDAFANGKARLERDGAA